MSSQRPDGPEPQPNFSLMIGEFCVGDLAWCFHKDLLWPCLITSKKYGFQGSGRKRTEDMILINKRLDAFHQQRLQYKVRLLPIDNMGVNLEENNDADMTMGDHELLPACYCTELIPTDDDHYNRALIQAIQIMSSWALPGPDIQGSRDQKTKDEHKSNGIIEEVVTSTVDDEVALPPIRKPIHIGCPSISGLGC
jgi:hypothetical protein